MHVKFRVSISTILGTSKRTTIIKRHVFEIFVVTCERKSKTITNVPRHGVPGGGQDAPRGAGQPVRFNQRARRVCAVRRSVPGVPVLRRVRHLHRVVPVQPDLRYDGDQGPRAPHGGVRGERSRCRRQNHREACRKHIGGGRLF